MRKIYMSSRVDTYQKPNGRAKFGGFACRIRTENTFDTFRGTKSYGHHAMLKETCKIERPKEPIEAINPTTGGIYFIEIKASDTRSIDKFPPKAAPSLKSREGGIAKAVTVETPEGKIVRYCGEKDQCIMVYGVVYSRRHDGIFRLKNVKAKIKTPKIGKVSTEKMPNEYKRVVINGKSYRVIRKMK